LAPAVTKGSSSEKETVEQRLDGVEAALGLKAPAIENRLGAVEARVEELADKGEPNPWLVGLDYVIKVVGAATPVVVLIVAFVIKDSVELAIKERELSIKETRLKIDEAQALDGLLKNFRKRDIGEDEAHRNALLILDYGNAGVGPLVQDLNVKEHRQVQADAAAHAIKVHAVMRNERGSVCLLLGRVQDMAPPIFAPLGLQRVSTLRQELGCETLK
jgi:hypothetical protein